MTTVSSLSKPDIPYWRLSGFYFFYFALLGALFTYWGVYLKEQGFSITQIGTVMASLMVTKVVAPNIWGWLGDKTQKRLSIVRWGAFLTVILFAFVLLKPGFVGMMVVMMSFSFFWNAILPQQEVVTLNHISGEAQLYSRIRVWGSIGFILTSAGFGLFFDSFSIDWLPYILLALMLGIWISTQMLYESDHHTHDEHSPSFLSQLFKPTVIIFFLLCFLMQITHGPYYAFFLIYLDDFGYSKFDVGLLIGLGVFAEVLVFLVMHRLMGRFSIKQLGVFCFLAAAVRWFITAYYPQHVALLVVAQLAHAATFGIFHAICIYLVHRYFSTQSSGQGQALYSALSFGAGGAIGAYFSGQIWDAIGATNTFLVAALIAILSMLLALWKMSDESPSLDER